MAHTKPVHQRLSVKAVLLGDSGVGKTSLATRWSTGIFPQMPSTTVGANHHRRRLQIDGEESDIFLWDTAGQEQYQALTPLYVRSASVAIIVTVINDPESFDHIPYWTNLLSLSAEVLPPIVLAVNKIDVMGDPGPSEEAIQAQYGGKFAGLFFVSANTNEGVDLLFACAAQTGYRFVRSRDLVVHQSEELSERKGNCC